MSVMKSFKYSVKNEKSTLLHTKKVNIETNTTTVLWGLGLVLIQLVISIFFHFILQLNELEVSKLKSIRRNKFTQHSK